jgi:hypothetical protein
MRDGHPAPNTFLIRHELSVENLVYENSCSRGPISFRRGSQYLVFRGEDGHLLGGVLFKGVKEKAWGYSVAELAPGGPAEWLAAVERAAGAVALSAGSR